MAILFSRPECSPATLAGHDGSASIAELLKTIAESTGEVLIICLLGYYGGRSGIIDARVKRSLNHLNQNIFTPALLFGKVAFTLTPSKLAELWIVPVGFVIISTISALCALVLGWVFRLSKSQRAFAIACATFMNSNSLPIALMQSLTYTVDGLRWGNHDTKDAMLGRALSYLVLFSTLGIILRWSYGIKLLSTADDEGQDHNKTSEHDLEATHPSASGSREDEQGDAAEMPLLPDGGHTSRSTNGTEVTFESTPRSRFSEGPITINRPPDLRDIKKPGRPVRRWTALGNGGDTEHAEFFHRNIVQPKRDFKREIGAYRSFPNTPARTPAASTYATSDDESPSDLEEHTSADESLSDEDFEGTGRRERAEPSRTRFQAWSRRNRRNCWSGFKRWIYKPVSRFVAGIRAFMTAPLYAALLSLLVACIRPVQLWLDQLLPVRNAIKSAGNCSVPITLLVLGSYFVAEPEAKSESDKRKQGKKALKKQVSSTSLLKHKFSALFALPKAKKDPQSKPGEGRTVFVSVVSRMIVAPLVMIPLLGWWAIKTTNIADDPVFIVTAVLVIGSAPAITLAQMTNAAGGSFERLISKTLFVSYVLLTFPTTIVLVLVGLEIAKKQM